MEECVINTEKRYAIKGRRDFLPGNPGRPKGALNKETRIKNDILGCWNSKSKNILKWKLKNPQTFLEAVRVLMAFMVKSETKNEFHFGDKHNTNVTNILNSGTKEEQDQLLNSSIERITRLRELATKEVDV